MSRKRKSLQCPFTWDIDEKLAEDYIEDEQPTINIDEQPVLAFINSVMITYIRAIKKDYVGAQNNLHKTNEIWNKLDKREIEEDDVSFDVLLHVMEATKYHLYRLANQNLNSLDVMKNLVSATNFQSERELGTINGCRSVIWSNFHEAGHKLALSFVKPAISYSPKCSVWYFIFGKNLRHRRRNENFGRCPLPDERKALLTCYELLTIPFYAIYVAEMYRENKEFHNSNRMFLDLYNEKPKNINTLLKLAKGLIGMKQFEKALSCLNYVEEKNPNNVVFLHYKGIYYQVQHNIQKAALYFKKAVESSQRNFRSDVQYIRSMGQLGIKDFNAIEYLEEMLDIYEFTAYKQSIHLHIAMQYYYKKKDLKSSLKNVLQAIQLNPESDHLKDFLCSTLSYKSYNMFEFLDDILLPKFDQLDNKSSLDIKVTVNKLKDICKQYKELTNK